MSVISLTPARLVCVLASAYLVATLYARSVAARDPGSWFFNTSTAYEARYTKTRQAQAGLFIDTANASTFPRPIGNQWAGRAPRMCIGILPAAREPRYLDVTIGSLLDGLTTEERDELHMLALLPHSDPTKHSAYREPWLHNLVDEVVHYNTSTTQSDHISALESEGAPFREKGLFDYGSLVGACLDKTDAPYIAIFEDDVVAAPDWYRQTLAGLAKSELKLSRTHDQPREFLYLRLFYTEQFLGWNSEDWLEHGLWSLSAVSTSWIMLLCARLWHDRMKRLLMSRVVMVACVSAAPLTVLLCFAVGRTTLLPLSAGVSVMNRYGCCSQGLVFPRASAQDLVSWFRESRIGFVDVLIEEYGDRNPGRDRFALVPPVIQHVGRRSSKDADTREPPAGGLSAAERIWSFEFERRLSAS
jgi:hypothetical protein